MLTFHLIVQPSNPEANQFSKAILPEPAEDQDDEEDPCPYEFETTFNKFSKMQDSKAAVTYDELLYHPCEDELNQAWAHSKLQKNSKEQYFQLSCSKCFTALTYQGQNCKDKKRLGDYLADVKTV